MKPLPATQIMFFTQIAFNYQFRQRETPSDFDLLTDQIKADGIALTAGGCGVLLNALFIQRPYRGPIAYRLRGVICLFAGLSLAFELARAAGVSRADSVFFQSAPNVGHIVLTAWSARNAKTATRAVQEI